MQLPKIVTTESGAERRAGFEFEFAGVEPNEASEIVTAILGGTIQKSNPFTYVVENTRYGKVSVEMDAAVLKERRYLKALDKMGVQIEPHLLDNLETALLGLSSTLVPCEIVLPPIPLSELDVLEELRDALRIRKAKGTRASLAYAFGLHINVEPPDLSVQTLTNYLRAFLLLQDNIRKRAEVDITRAVSPYIDRYPDEYVHLLAAPDYAPESISELVSDYLHHNPTRNRPLDMYPLFAHIDKETVFDNLPQQEAELIKARPAFHFRLPNCRIDEPLWTVESEWEQWLLVEKLASDPERLETMSRHFMNAPGFPMTLVSDSWAKQSEKLLYD